jgi:hypothetical protein
MLAKCPSLVLLPLSPQYDRTEVFDLSAFCKATPPACKVKPDTASHYCNAEVEPL